MGEVEHDNVSMCKNDAVNGSVQNIKMNKSERDRVKTRKMNGSFRPRQDISPLGRWAAKNQHY